MPTPDFERLSVLIVDDTRLFRSLILSVFKSIGARQIFTAENGVEAIQFLKLVETAPERAGTSQVDLIVTDLMMPKMNGLMLLRWLRLHPASPNRFVPVIAISGAAETDVVATARDLGATEIVGKPVSADTIGNKLLSVVNHPRQFVLAPKYFGPDRRRSERPFGQERRIVADDTIQVINAGDGTKFIRPAAKVVYFRLRNRLKDKIFLGAAYDDLVPPFDPAVLRYAQERIQDFAGDYADWVDESIRTLQVSTSALLDGSGERPALLRRIAYLALELGSQGAIFHYPLVSKFGKSLYALTRNPKHHVLDRRYFQLLHAHVEALHTVTTQHITGDGGLVGQEISAELEKAHRKYGAVVPG
jgi:CheY-like chemotaxis protein